MLKRILSSLLVILLMTVLAGVVYPVVVTLIAQAALSHQANGSFIVNNGQPVGSELIGQVFVGDKYFHSRPSAAGSGYDANSSGGSNLGPTNAKLVAGVKQNIEAFKRENGISSSRAIPADIVTASASGLDPEISVEAAMLQANRVARSRNIEVAKVEAAIKSNTSLPLLGFIGQRSVNVLNLNLRMDSLVKQ